MAETEARTKANEEAAAPRERGLMRLWAGVLLAPFAFLFNLQVNYTLTQEICYAGWRKALLHIMTLFFLLLTTGGGLIAWRNWGRAGREWPDEAEDKAVRNRLLSAVGLLFSVLCFLIIVAQWIPQFIFDPCMR